VVLARKTGNADWLRQAGAKVTLVAGAPFTMTVSTGGADFEKGVFHFYDLPAGQYRLKAETGFCSGAAGQEFTVTVPSPGSANVINLEDKVSYSGLPGNFAWQDIKTIGRRLNISTVDDGWEPVNLVLPFPYWNNSINTIGVSSNGFVMTDLRNAQAVGSDYYPHLGDSESAGVIAPYWGDLRPGMVVTDGVWLLDGPDWFVLQWAAWEWPGTSDRPWREFQLMGLKGNGTIRFFYKDSPAGGAPWAIGVQGGLGELVKWWGTQPVSGSGIEFTRITEGCHTEQVYLPAIHRGIDNPPPGGDPTPTPYPASATPEP
jgi:hypothetical protein